MLVSSVGMQPQNNNRNVKFTSGVQVIEKAKKTTQIVFTPKRKSLSIRLLESIYGPIKEPRVVTQQMARIENKNISPKTFVRAKDQVRIAKASVFKGICVSPKISFVQDASATAQSRFITNDVSIIDTASVGGTIKGKVFYRVMDPKKKRFYDKESSRKIYEFLERLDEAFTKKHHPNLIVASKNRSKMPAKMIMMDMAKLEKTADISGFEHFRSTDFAIIGGKVQARKVDLAMCSKLEETGVINCETLDSISHDAKILGHINTESCDPELLAKYPENITIMPKGWFELMQKPAA